MAYSFNDNDLNSCIELCELFYNLMFNETGHFNILYAENGEITNEYLGAKKEDFYYYRGYAIQSFLPERSGYGINNVNFRTPFHINDNNIRPFFAFYHYPDHEHKFE